MKEIELVIQAIFPVIIYIGIGFFLRAQQFFKEEGWHAVEKLAYYVLFPALIIYELATAKFSDMSFYNAAVALNVALLVMFLLSFGAWIIKDMNGPKFTSIVQNNIRWNSYVVIGVTSALFPEYRSIVVLAIASMIPTANILSVWSLLFWGKPEVGKKLDPVTGLIRNPLILACLIGGLLQFYKIPLIDPFGKTFEMLGLSVMPLGLMAVGAGLDIENMKDNTASRMFWGFVRLVGLPSLALLSCYIFGVYDRDMIMIILIATSAPTATNGYILARQLGGDAPFMASLVGTTTLFSVITIPAMIFLFNFFIK
ncbi:MAG: AEC family transporter [Pseudomonadota bacterium]